MPRFQALPICASGHSGGESLLRIVEQFTPDQRFHLSDEGQFYKVPAILVLIQAITHAAEHHAQMATILSQQGIVLPELTSWAFYHEVVEPQREA